MRKPLGTGTVPGGFCFLRRSRGFTLLEVLIVMVILGVLAGLAIPAYQRTIKKAQAQEALTALAMTRQPAVRFFAVNNTYVGIANDLSNLEYNPNTAVGGQTTLFTYAAGNQGAATLTLTATAKAGDGTVAITQDGVVTKTGVYQ